MYGNLAKSIYIMMYIKIILVRFSECLRNIEHNGIVCCIVTVMYYSPDAVLEKYVGIPNAMETYKNVTVIKGYSDSETCLLMLQR